MVMYIPPELTDIIIHSCVSCPSDTPLNPTDRSTVLACSLVCRSWVPASRSRTFTRITLNCTPNDSHSFIELIDSPSCSFREVVQEIAFVVPDPRTAGRFSGIDTGTIDKILDLLSLKLVIIQGDPKTQAEGPPDPSRVPRSSPFSRPVLLREHLRLTFTQAFSKASTDSTSLTSLALTSLSFECFSDLTLLLRSFPHITSLHLDNLSFALFNLSPHLPPQQLEKLHITGSQVVLSVLSWLIFFPTISMPPIRELRLGVLSQSKEVFFLARYLVAAQGTINYVEVEFKDDCQADNGSQLLNETIQNEWQDLANIPRIVVSTPDGLVEPAKTT